MNEVIDKPAIIAQAQHRPSSEATQVEQSRAIAQVQGALVVARAHPRDEIDAMNRIRAACANAKLAERAFFRFPRAGSTVQGPSIHLATEMARCWGNVEFGIAELRRDDHKGESEMIAVAWDLETNTRVTNSFIVPHKRDKRNGPEALVDMRDIYENNANQGARRLRECIFRILPGYVREEAQDICHATLRDGGGIPIEKRREALLEAFAKMGVTQKQIEKRTGQTAGRLTEVDIANLRIVYNSIRRGEISKAEEFPEDAGTEATEALKANAKPDPIPEGGDLLTTQESPSQQQANKFERQLLDTDSREDLDAAWGEIEPHLSALDGDLSKGLTKVYERRKTEVA